MTPTPADQASSMASSDTKARNVLIGGGVVALLLWWLWPKGDGTGAWWASSGAQSSGGGPVSPAQVVTKASRLKIDATLSDGMVGAELIYQNGASETVYISDPRFRTGTPDAMNPAGANYGQWLAELAARAGIAVQQGGEVLIRDPGGSTAQDIARAINATRPDIHVAIISTNTRDGFLME